MGTARPRGSAPMRLASSSNENGVAGVRTGSRPYFFGGAGGGLALGVVGEHRRLLVVVGLHLLQVGPLLLQVAALLLQLRLQTRPGGLAFLDLLDGTLDVDVPDLHVFRERTPGRDSNGESKQKAMHLVSFSPVFGTGAP